MSTIWKNLQEVSFIEMPISAFIEADKKVHPKSFEKDLSLKDYCFAIFEKIMTIGLSEINEFINAQSLETKNPVQWLNQFEKLIVLNIEYFETKKLQHRHTKFISQIDIKRESLIATKNTPAQQKSINKDVACIAGEKVFNFTEVQAKLNTFNSFIEKKKYLKKVLHEYKQSDPDIVYTKVKPFDKQVEAELKYNEELEEMESKSNSNQTNGTTIGNLKNKIQFNGNINQLGDIFYQLHRELFISGKPYIDGSINDLVAVIVNSFVDKDGKELSPETIKTTLTPSKTDKRPKPHKRIDINKIL